MIFAVVWGGGGVIKNKQRRKRDKTLHQLLLNGFDEEKWAVHSDQSSRANLIVIKYKRRKSVMWEVSQIRGILHSFRKTETKTEQPVALFPVHAAYDSETQTNIFNNQRRFKKQKFSLQKVPHFNLNKFTKSQVFCPVAWHVLIRRQNSILDRSINQSIDQSILSYTSRVS